MRITLITAFVSSIIATGAMADKPTNTSGGYTFGAGAVSGGISTSSVSNGNGRAEFQSYSGAQQTSAAKFSDDGSSITVESSGFDAAGSQGLVRGAGVGFTGAGAVRGGFAFGGSSFSDTGFKGNKFNNGKNDD
jgi:hypothetical protein